MSDTQMPSPSAQIINTANTTRTVSDSDGRVIVWKPLSILDQARLYRAIGAESADNAPFVRLASVAAGVQSIDGTPYPAPTNLTTVDAAIGRLGDNGYLAILTELNAGSDVPQADDKAVAKN